MQPLATLLASLVLGAGAAVGVTTYMIQQPKPAGDAGDSEVAARVAALEAKITKLTEQLAKAPVGGVPERRSLDVVSDAQIEAAVAKYLKRRGDAVASPAAATPTPTTVAGGTLKETFQQLQGDLKEDEIMAIWKQLRAAGKADEMLDMFVANAAANPSSAAAQVQAGMAYLMRLQEMPPGPESGRLAMGADEAFDRTLKLDPNHWEARFVKAQALSFWPPMFGKQAEAIKNLETLMGQQEASATQEPKFARTYWTLGNLYSAQGKSEKAMAIWKKGATLFPRHAGLREKLGESRK